MATRPNAAAKEIRSILTAFATVRILKRIADGSARRDTIRPVLPASEAYCLDRTLARLRRRGWLKSTNSELSLTREGRKALRAATSSLKPLAELTPSRARTQNT